MPAATATLLVGHKQVSGGLLHPRGTTLPAWLLNPHQPTNGQPPNNNTNPHVGPAESACLCWQTAPLTAPHSPPWTPTTALLMLSACTPLNTQSWSTPPPPHSNKRPTVVHHNPSFNAAVQQAPAPSHAHARLHASLAMHGCMLVCTSHVAPRLCSAH